MRVGTWIGLAAAIAGSANVAMAQQATVSTPLTGVGNSFFESYSTRWGFDRRWDGGSMFFNFGGPAAPPFGTFQPGAGANLGFAGRGANGGFFFNFSAAQGSNQILTSATPSLTLQNGTAGAFGDLSIRPFVVETAPLRLEAGVSPVLERLNRLAAEGKTPSGRRNTRMPSRPAASHQEASPRSYSSAEHGEMSIVELRQMLDRK